MITTVSNILLILYALFHGAFSSLKKKRFKKVFWNTATKRVQILLILLFKFKFRWLLLENLKFCNFPTRNFNGASKQ